MKKEKVKRPRGRPQSKKLQEAVARLLGAIEGSLLEGEEKSWRINDLTLIVSQDEYVTEKKKKLTYQAIAIVRELVRAKWGKLFYSVPGNGYKLVESKEDHELVFERWFSYTKALFTKTLIPVYQRGQLNDANSALKIREVQGLLKELN